MTKTAELDAAKVEAFGHKLLDILNSGMAANMISIGHRTGIFDAMAALLASATSAEIAAAANGWRPWRAPALSSTNRGGGRSDCRLITRH
jgi:hypothetical protein